MGCRKLQFNDYFRLTPKSPIWRFFNLSVDSLGQVTSGIKYDSSDNKITGLDLTYTFDDIGNRKTHKIDTATTNYTSNLINQYTATTTPSESFTYDDDGNMETVGDWTYTWNGENRLITAVDDVDSSDSDTNGDKKVEFDYDYQGRRFEKIASTHNGTTWVVDTTEVYAYDNWNNIATFNASDVLQTSRLWGEEGLLAEDDGTDVYLTIFDGNRNIMGYVDASDGTSVADYEYDAFGRTVSSTGTKKDDFVFKFSSYFTDSETDLVYYGYRYYDADMGRWINRDPIEESGGNNVYGFVGNDGINKVDLLGLKWKFSFFRVPDPIGGGTPHMSIEGHLSSGGVVQETKWEGGRRLTGPKNFCSIYGTCTREALPSIENRFNPHIYVDTDLAAFQKAYRKGSALQPSGELRYKVWLSGGKQGDPVVITADWIVMITGNVTMLVKGKPTSVPAGSFTINNPSKIVKYDKEVNEKGELLFKSGQIKSNCFVYKKPIHIATVEVGMQYMHNKRTNPKPWIDVEAIVTFGVNQ